MSATLSNPSVCRENALNALLEIRACHDELRTFLADTFDRLDEVVGKLRNLEPAPAHVERHADADAMQDQIDHLTRLVTDLARTVKTPEQTAVGNSGVSSSEAET
jgi:hypothetical protein